MARKLSSLTEGPIGRILLVKSIPMALGIGFAIAFNAIDTYFISQLGDDHLAAFTACFPVIFGIIGVAMGLGTGASAVISRVIGEGDKGTVQRLTTDTIVLAFLVTAVMLLLAFAFFDQIFSAMDVPDRLMPLVREYMYIWMPGSIFLVPPMLGNFALRATGDTATPSMIMGIAVGINLILDPLFIFGFGPVPELGLAGAAIATLIGRAFTLVGSWYFLSKKYDMLCYTFSIKEFIVSARKILQVGLPSAMTSLIVPAGVFFVNKFSFGIAKEAAAAVGAASRVEILMFVPFMAIGGVLSAFIGQNIGAGKIDRIRKVIRMSLTFSFLWGAAVFVLLYLLRGVIGGIFSDGDYLVEKYIIIYLAIQPIGLAFRGVTVTAVTTLNVLKKAWISFAINIFQTVVLFVPIAYFLKEEYGFEGIFWGSVITSVIVAIASFIILKRNDEIYGPDSLMVK
jgi:putative MATE family efflux protein